MVCQLYLAQTVRLQKSTLSAMKESCQFAIYSERAYARSPTPQILPWNRVGGLGFATLFRRMFSRDC
jgi:hypothetical protein